MEHHQTVARPHNGTPGCWATVWSVSTNLSIWPFLAEEGRGREELPVASFSYPARKKSLILRIRLLSFPDSAPVTLIRWVLGTTKIWLLIALLLNQACYWTYLPGWSLSSLPKSFRKFKNWLRENFQWSIPKRNMDSTSDSPSIRELLLFLI